MISRNVFGRGLAQPDKRGKMALAERLCRTEQAAVERLQIIEPAKAGATRGAHHLVPINAQMLENQARHADGIVLSREVRVT